MSPRTAPPFRADHVGSLLRPPDLLRAREGHSAGEIGADDLREVEDAAIRDAVAMQEGLGLQSATDGEFRRALWHMDFILQLGGVTTTEGRYSVKFRNAEGEIEWTPNALHVAEKLHLKQTIFGDHFAALRDMTTTARPKMTIPSPSMVHYRGGRSAVDPSVYPDFEEFLTDLSRTYAGQVRGLYDLGCRYLQMDDTTLAYLNDPAQRELLAAEGGDPQNQHLLSINGINAALRNRPEDLSVTVHLCRGNYRSSWVAEGGYDHVAEALFSELDVDGYFLEFDDERSGTFEPLRYLPKDKYVVLGLLTTKHGRLEDKDDLKRRIDMAARYAPLEQLCISPQCGFSSTVNGNDLTIDDEKAKLALLVELAQEVWG